MMRVAAVLALAGALALAGGARADLYRWREPGSGSIRYSNYPPPWLENGVSAPGMPRVEVVPDARDAAKPAATGAAEPPAPEADKPPARPTGGAASGAPARAAAAPAGSPSDLDARRRELLSRIARLPAQPDLEAAKGALEQSVAAYYRVMADLDAAEPRASAGRRAEDQPLLQRAAESISNRVRDAAAGVQPPATEREPAAGARPPTDRR